jgi:hypothetical protein
MAALPSSIHPEFFLFLTLFKTIFNFSTETLFLYLTLLIAPHARERHFNFAAPHVEEWQCADMAVAPRGHGATAPSWRSGKAAAPQIKERQGGAATAPSILFSCSCVTTCCSSPSTAPATTCLNGDGGGGAVVVRAQALLATWQAIRQRVSTGWAMVSYMIAMTS